MKTGILLLHGFTSDERSVDKLLLIAQELGYQTEAPRLRGHGLHYRDLYGKRWEHWREDVRQGYQLLRERVDQVVVVGFSMGGLLALELAAQPDVELAGVAALAPATHIAHPLAPIAWMARGWYRFLPMGKSVGYSDPDLAIADDSYPRLATDAFVSFYRASRRIRRVLPQISAPLLLIHSRRDRVIKPCSSQFAFDQVKSVTKELIWLEQSGHAMLDDIEADTVVAHVRNFLLRFIEAPLQSVGRHEARTFSPA
ncbi:MAG: alpha/beta fold hydrolase [Herpetosiphonaceae bacterium]|nr:alpha/beta fold hydrolase [Herpetosiphonaceae bacterium]